MMKIKQIFSDELFRHTVILFAGMATVHGCNLLFQMAVSRALPEKEYALLAAFLGALIIIGYPLMTLTSGLSYYSSLLTQAGRAGDVRRLLVKWLFLTGGGGFLLGAATFFFSGPVSGFLHLDRAAPVIIAGAVLPALFWLPVLNGVGQGLQLFGWTSVSGAAGALLKLLLGAGFVWLLYPACGWAMLGHSAGIYLSAAVLAAGLVRALHGKQKTAEPLPSMRFYLLQSFFVLLAFSVLMNADVVLVKHYIPEDTGFAYAATLGRIAAFLPAAVAMVMFPKVASTGGTSARHRNLFFRSFRYAVCFTALAAAGCFLFPRLLLFILFGIRDAPASMTALTRLMTAAMSLSALLNVTVQFLLARRRFKALLPVIFCGLLYLLSARFFHERSAQIAAASVLFNAAALLAGFYAVCRKEENVGPDPDHSRPAGEMH